MWGFQGDVIVEKVNELPKGARRVDNPILAKGEATGHAHKVDLAEVEVWMDERDNIYTIPKTDAGFTITHEEHNAVEVPLKKNEVGRVFIQREADPFSDETRQIRD